MTHQIRLNNYLDINKIILLMNKDIEIVEQDKLTIDKSINTVATYSFRGEDHTLGNLIRSMLMKE